MVPDNEQTLVQLAHDDAYKMRQVMIRYSQWISKIHLIQIVSATKRKGPFRPDLYFYLKVSQFMAPPFPGRLNH